MAVSRALVQVGVVAAQWSLAERGDLTQPRQSQQSPARSKSLVRVQKYCRVQRVLVLRHRCDGKVILTKYSLDNTVERPTGYKHR